MVLAGEDVGAAGVVGAVDSPAKGTSAAETDTPKAGAAVGSVTRTADVRPVDNEPASPVLSPAVQWKVTWAAAAADGSADARNAYPSLTSFAT